MDEFNALLKVVDRLLGPGGCPWDQKQTMKTIRADLLEEACELIEAIDLEDNHHIEEELGDLFFCVIFLIRLAEKENRTQMANVLTHITEKLIRRHPHVFGDEVIETIHQLYHKWDQIKQTEKGKESRKSLLDGIPKGLPALARAQKIVKKLKKSDYNKWPISREIKFDNDEELGSILAAIAQTASEKGLDAEHALKNTLTKLEQNFRAYESQSNLLQ